MKNQKGISLIKLLLIIVIMIIGYILLNKILYTKADKIKAEYEARFHIISFDTDGGKEIAPKKVESFGGISNVKAEKEGYIFEGWLLDGQLIDHNSTTKLTQDITVKAKYRKREDNNTNNYSSNNNNNPSSSNNASNSNNNSSNTNKNNSNNQTQPENKKTYNINVRKVAENIFENNMYVGRGEFDEYALTVMNYQTETNNSKVGGVKDGQEWVIVNMKFENKSDSTVVIDKNDFKIVDGADRYGYRPWYEHLDTELGTIEIRSGQTATFSVRFVYYKNNEMFLRYYNLDFDPIGYVAIKLR